jgi:hypothetical protein
MQDIPHVAVYVDPLVDVAAPELEARPVLQDLQVLRRPGDEVVEREYAGPTLEQRLTEVGPDEAGPSRDDRARRAGRVIRGRYLDT